MEARWLEGQEDDVRRGYRRAKGTCSLASLLSSRAWRWRGAVRGLCCSVCSPFDGRRERARELARSEPKLTRPSLPPLSLSLLSFLLADWQLHYPPSSVPTDITLSQFLTIQEKGVSAWCFEPDYESNPSLYVQSRTEITFLADGPGMPIEEGGGNSVMANLPLPKLNEVYYFECKMYEKPEGTDVAIGLATKPYPSFRLPGE